MILIFQRKLSLVILQWVSNNTLLKGLKFILTLLETTICKMNKMRWDNTLTNMITNISQIWFKCSLNTLTQENKDWLMQLVEKMFMMPQMSFSTMIYKLPKIFTILVYLNWHEILKLLAVNPEDHSKLKIMQWPNYWFLINQTLGTNLQFLFGSTWNILTQDNK